MFIEGSHTKGMRHAKWMAVHCIDAERRLELEK
jgi:hypothetical protein